MSGDVDGAPEVDANFRRLFDSSAIATVLVDRSGRLRTANQAMCEFLGYDADTLAQMNWADVSAAEYLPESIQAVEDLVAGRKDACRLTKQYIHADGHRLWGAVTLSSMRNPAGKVDHLIAQIIDITEQKELRAKQAESDARFRRMMENSSVGMSLNAPDGRFVEVNEALCDMLGYDATTLCTKTWQDVTAAATLEADIRRTEDLAAGLIDNYRTTKQFIHADGHLVWVDLSASCIRRPDGELELFVAQMVDVTTEVELRSMRDESDARFRRIMESSNVGMAIATPDGRFDVVNQALCDQLGYDEKTLKTKSWQNLTPEIYMDADIKNMADLLAGRLDTYRVIKQHIHADGHLIWVDVSASCLRDADGAVQYLVGQIIDITEQVEARAKEAEADARLRRLMETSNVAIALVGPEGKMDVVNQALCDLFGYDEATMKSKTWQELTPPDFLESDLKNTEDLLAGRLDTYRVEKQHIHADGHLLWVDLSVSCLRDSRGAVQYLLAQCVDITEEVKARELLIQRERENRILADRLQTEIRDAAKYVESVLPGDLDGPVEVSSRYLPSLDLGGDGFHYRWLDDDHLTVYLIDVSGHGIRPALLSMSVHNLIRSGSLPAAVLLKPDRLLERLNALFQMDDQGDSYFTIWYGVYQRSTRTLHYASAGHPPALALEHGDDGVVSVNLATTANPIGMFLDSAYTSDSYLVPAGGQLLLYSDGAFELSTRNPEGKLWTQSDFVNLSTELAAKPGWSLDGLVERLKSVSPTGEFDDDCALVLLTFP